MPSPGEHRIVIGQEHDAFQARSHGWHLRDTITILLPGPRTAFAFLLRWPLQGTVVDTVLAHGTGALNINGCRVGYSGKTLDEVRKEAGSPTQGTETGRMANWGMREHSVEFHPAGRWPSNLVLVHAPDCVQMGSKTVKGSHDTTGVWGPSGSATTYGGGWHRDPQARRPNFTSPDGTETVQNWSCAPHCPVRLLDLQSGSTNSKSGGMSTKALGVMNDDAWVAKDVPRTGHDDAGGASRFYPQFADLTAAVRWLACLIDQ